MSPDRIEALSRSLADGTSRRSLLKLLGVGAAGTAVTVVGLHTAGGPNEALAATVANKLTGIPVSGRRKDVRFQGRLTIHEFQESNGGIIALGRLTGKATNDEGDSKKIAKNVAVPVTVTSSEIQTMAICTVLDLVLGPIHLNLLGLHLDTNRIHIKLTANSEEGLLGSLLCGLAGPDNPLAGGVNGVPLATVVAALNAILAALLA